MKRVYIAAVLLAVLLATAVAEEEILAINNEGIPSVVAVTGATILTMAGEPIENGTVIIADGVISAIGKNIDIPSGAKVIDAKGKYVMPGMILPYSYYGLIGYRGNDSQEFSSYVTPEMRVTDAIYPTPPRRDVLRRAGITSLVVAPDNRNIVGGQGALIRPYGLTVEKMTVKAPASMVFALGEPPKTTHRSIMTRMGSAAKLRETLQRAVEHKEKLDGQVKKVEKYKEQLAEWEAKTEEERGDKPEEPKPLKADYAWDPMVAVLEGKLPAVMYAQRADDILTMLRIGEEFGVNFILYGGAESYKVADILAEKKVPVIFGPIRYPMGGMESYESKTTTPGILSKKGITVALRGDEQMMYGLGGLRELTLDMALAVRDGMDPDEALKMVTINPAKIYGFDDRKGSLEKGKDADIVIFDGHPLSTQGFCVGVISISPDGPSYIWTSTKEEILKDYTTTRYQ